MTTPETITPTSAISAQEPYTESLTIDQIAQANQSDLKEEGAAAESSRSEYSLEVPQDGEVGKDLNKEEQEVVKRFNNDVLRSSDSSVIIMKSELPKGNRGSLLNLFECTLFNIHMSMRYLETKNQEGIIQFLVHKLHDEPIENLDLYLPQLCYLILTKPDPGCIRVLEKFILQLSMANSNLGFRALHYFFSWSEDDALKARYADEAVKFYNLLEGALVNQDLPKQYQSCITSGNDSQFEQVKEMSEYMDKLYKADYIGLQLHYMHELKNLSLQLKDPVLKETQVGQSRHLHKTLIRLNEWLNSEVRQKADKVATKETRAKYRGGIVFPFKQGDDSNPFVILGVIPELAQIFETKVRAPYKAVFEVCRLSELIEEEEERENQSQGGLSSEKKEGAEEIGQQVVDVDKENEEEEMKGQGATIEEQGEAGGGTGGVGGLFSMTIADGEALADDTLEGHLDQDNPFGIEEDDEKEDKTAELQPKQLASTEKKATGEDQSEEKTEQTQENEEIKVELAENGRDEDEFDGDGLDDWECIDASELPQFEYRPPDFTTDPFKEKWKNIRASYQAVSPHGTRKTYALKPMIVKANDDCRQEVLAIQLMKRLTQIFKKAGLSLWLRPYEILITSGSSAMIEFIPDSISIHALKRKLSQLKEPRPQTLKQFYQWYFISNYEEAQQNFIRSLAGYSLFTYLFNIKDRHNGNILLDRQGHIIHIDFGFMLQNTPGQINFEGAPFKLTSEYVELMDGPESDKFDYFKSLINAGMIEVRKHLEDLTSLISIMMKDSVMPCFKRPETLVAELTAKLSVKDNVGTNKKNEFDELSDRLTKASLDNFFTNQYDNFQWLTNNIEK